MNGAVSNLSKFFLNQDASEQKFWVTKINGAVLFVKKVVSVGRPFYGNRGIAKRRLVVQYNFFAGGNFRHKKASLEHIDALQLAIPFAGGANFRRQGRGGVFRDGGGMGKPLQLFFRKVIDGAPVTVSRQQIVGSSKNRKAFWKASHSFWKIFRPAVFYLSLKNCRIFCRTGNLMAQ